MLSGEKQEELKQATKSLKEMYTKIDQYYVNLTKGLEKNNLFYRMYLKGLKNSMVQISKRMLFLLC